MHCSHAGHGIVGDYTYTGDRLSYRMFLHAAALELPLEWPTTRTVEVQAPIGPFGWEHMFEAREPMRTPLGWPNAGDLVG